MNVHRDEYSDEEFEHAKKVTLPVMIAKMDCVSHPQVCNDQEDIRAYPTLRLFVDGEPWKGGDYRGHRTVLEMVDWLTAVEEQHKEAMGHDEALKKVHTAHESKSTLLKPNCQWRSFKMLTDSFLTSSRKATHSEWRRVRRGAKLEWCYHATKTKDASQMGRRGSSWLSAQWSLAAGSCPGKLSYSSTIPTSWHCSSYDKRFTYC